MPSVPHAPVTVLLQRVGAGEQGAAHELLNVVYAELRVMARSAMRTERRDHTLQATALAHEAWLRLIGSEPVEWSGRAHFFGAAGCAMRRILVDHARTRGATKRGGAVARVPLEDSLAIYEERAIDLIALDEALDRLAGIDDRLARIVELRFFAGCDLKEVAKLLAVSVPTVERGWRLARAWLRAEIEPST